jgi:hypothetical protein
VKLLYILAALLLWQIASWTFAPPPPPVVATPPKSDTAYGYHEKYIIDARISQRQDAFKALELPTGSLCDKDGHDRFVSGLGGYYYHRQNQMERYPETYGKLGADYIARQWSGTDDQRIDRLTQEAYARGYLKPGDFEAVARRMILKVVENERVFAKGCAG